mmetsp:Transcript_111658/g.360334  ORF Transcript_111658/g.360334 Transcript_111658/m.360334 type:complete len:265 (-) Transcript_111658:310-1104(-)
MRRFVFSPMCLAFAAYAEDGQYEVRCNTLPVPGLTAFVPLFRTARICYPKAEGTFPLHLFAHGDWGGGAFFWLGYSGLQEQLASYGFVVPAYLSCWFDIECSNGQASFLEALKTLTFLERHPNIAPVDWTKPYSASGHSTGLRDHWKRRLLDRAAGLGLEGLPDDQLAGQGLHQRAWGWAPGAQPLPQRRPLRRLLRAGIRPGGRRGEGQDLRRGRRLPAADAGAGTARRLQQRHRRGCLFGLLEGQDGCAPDLCQLLRSREGR